MQVRGIKSIDTMASDAVSLAPLNLGADSVALARRPFGQRYWAGDQRPTRRIDVKGCKLSFDTSFAANAKE